MSGGRVPAMINFTSGAANVLGACRAAQVDTILTAHAFVEKARLEKLIAADREAGAHRLSGRHSQDGELRRQAARGAASEQAAGRAQARRLGRGAVHLRHGRHAQGRRAFPPQRAGQCRASRGPDRFRTRGPAVHGAAGVPFVRLHGRHRAAADFRRADLSLSVAAALSHRAGIGLRHLRNLFVRHRYVPRRLCAHGQRLRLPLAALHRLRRRADQGIDPPHLSGKVRHAHPRRLRRDRNLAGAGAQHADVQQVRHRRPAVAGHAGESWRRSKASTREPGGCASRDRT